MKEVFQESLEKFLDRVTRRRLLLGTAFLVAAFHFWASWNFSLKLINSNNLGTIVQPVREFFAADTFRFWEHNLNYYTGLAIFVIPFLLIHPAPATLRAVLIASMALSSAFAFLAYTKITDFRTGLVGVLILLNMSIWTLFRGADYAYSLMFISIVLYLFTLWDSEEEPRNRYLYATAFLAGIFFYFKAVIAYILGSLSAGKLIEDKTVLEKMGLKGFLLASLCLVFGLLPFLASGLESDFAYISEFQNGNSAATGNLIEVAEFRATVISSVMNPFRFQTDMDAEMSKLDLNLFSVLFLPAVFLALLRRENIGYVSSLVMMFLALLLVPPEVNWKETMFIMPLIPLAYISALNSLETEKLPEIKTGLIAILVIALVAPYAANSSEVTYSTDKGFKTWNDHKVVDYRTERELREINIEGTLVTNSGRVYILNLYHLERELLMLAPEDSQQYRGDVISRWPILHRSPIPLTRELPERATYILKNDQDCFGEVEHCGYNASYIIEKLNLSEKDSNQFRFNGNEYTLIKTP